MAMQNLKALMKEKMVEDGERKPALLKRKPFQKTEPMKKTGLAAKLTGKM